MRIFNWQYGLWGSWLLLGITGFAVLFPLLENNYRLTYALLFQEAAHETSEQIWEEIQAKRAKIVQLERSVQTDMKQYFTREETGKLFAQINGFVKHNGIQLVQLKLHPMETEGNFEILKITLKARAEFGPLLQFFYRLEKEIAGCRIENVSVTALGKGKPQVESQLTLRCYLRKENVTN